MGIAGMVMLILVIYAFPLARERWFPPALPDLSYADSLWMRQVQVSSDSTGRQVKAAPDFFDPNTADLSTLLALGFSKRVADNLLRYRAKGGRIRKREDLRRIWGMDSLLYEAVAPRIDIAETGSASYPEKENHRSDYPEQERMAFQSGKQPEKAVVKLDINAADSMAWLALPGIGPGYTRRILAFRQKLGGFYSVEQLQEVYGIDTLRIRSLIEAGQLSLQTGIFRRIPLATASFETLDAHPYISRNQARVILAYRQQHNGIRNAAEFRQIAVFSRSEADRILPYLDFRTGQ